MTLRPSSLPMLAQCPSFESGSTEFSELGTDRHAALKAHFAGDDSLLDLLDEEDQTGIRWAAEYIRLKTPLSDHPIEWEIKRSFVATNFEDMEGTPDAVCGQDIFDFKWRPRDYTAQLACYALMEIERFEKLTTLDPVIRCHILFGQTRRAEVLHFDRAAAETIIEPILKSCEQPTPRVCDYCGWCAKKLTCVALTDPAKKVAMGYADLTLVDVASWHPSEMDKPEDIALGLTIWRRVLKKWGESMEFHAQMAAEKKGLKLPGYELRPSKGKRYVADVKQSFALTGLPPDEFIKACDVRLNTSKKYPDKLGLDAVARAYFNEPSLAAAKRNMLKKLESVIAQGKETLRLKAVKGEEEETEE